MSKQYLTLDAYELGQINALIDKNRLGEALRTRLEQAVYEVYLDSGFADNVVFGDQRYKAHRDAKEAYYTLHKALPSDNGLGGDK